MLGFISERFARFYQRGTC